MDSKLFYMLRHTILHVMTHREHDVTHFGHGMTHQLHVATHFLHNTTHPNPLNALSDVACRDRGSVWNYLDPFRIFIRIVLLDLADVYVDNFLNPRGRKGIVPKSCSGTEGFSLSKHAWLTML